MIQRERNIKRIIPFIDKPVIKVITGIRRCGKSTLLQLIRNEIISRGELSENILLINKDSRQFDSIKTYPQLVNFVYDFFFYKNGKKYLLIDEVQEIEGWEKALSGFLTDNTADLYITSSNSKLLSSELATYISGRYVEFKIYTLVFSEFLTFRKENDFTDINQEFNLFMKYDGFPGIHHMDFEDDVIEQYISSIYSTILLKDVVARNNLRDIALLERITRFVADNCGNITSSKKITDFLKSQKIKGTVDTVQNYLSMMSSAFILHKVNRFDIKGKRLHEIHENISWEILG